MNGNDIIHVVRAKDTNMHTLYLRDGRVVQFDVFSGQVHGVVRLPSDDALGQAERTLREQQKGRL